MSEALKQHREEDLPIGVGADMERRTFLKTTLVSPMLRTKAVSALSQMAGTETKVAVAVETVKRIPIFHSPIAIERMKQLLGDKSEAIFGKPLSEAMPDLLITKAARRFPAWMTRWHVEQDPLEASGIIYKMLRKRAERYESNSEHDPWLEDVLARVMERLDASEPIGNLLLKISEEPETAILVESALGECTALEIHERAYPKLAGDIVKMLDRLRLTTPSNNTESYDYIYSSQIGDTAIVETLCAEEGENFQERCMAMSRLYCSEEGMQQALEKLTLDPETRQLFMEHACRLLRDHGMSTETLTISRAERSESVKQNTNQSIQPPSEEISAICESIQHPFQRVMSQISMLADPSYERQWKKNDARIV